MALATNEAWRRGFVFNTTNNLMVVTTSQVGATMWGGYLRDPDGRLVVMFG